MKNKPMFMSRPGLSYGAITSIDIKQDGSEILAGTESGEMMEFDLAKKFVDETQM